MKPNIPKKNRDLRRYVIRRKCTQIALYILWMVAFGTGAYTYNQAHQTYPPERRIIGWRLVLWLIAAALLGFFLFRIRKLFTDRTYTGTVQKSGLAHTYTSSADPGTTAPVNYDFRTQTQLVILTDDGKRRRIRFDQKPGFYLYYYEGNRVCHFAGLPYPVCNPACRVRPEQKNPQSLNADDLSEGYLCAACGFLNNQDPSGRCGKCMHTLIDPADIWIWRAESCNNGRKNDGENEKID